MNIHLYLLHTLFLYILKYAENSKKLIVNAKKKMFVIGLQNKQNKTYISVLLWKPPKNYLVTTMSFLYIYR